MKKKKRVNEEGVHVVESEENEPCAEPREGSSEASSEEKTLDLLLEEKTDEAARNYDMFLRARADIQNLKKRQEKEKAGYISYATETVVLEILPAIDNLERAIEHASCGDGDNLSSLIDGVKLTIEQMNKALSKFGVKEIEAVGNSFDPALHHAISHEDCAGAEPGSVIKEFQKGYLLKDKLLRPSIVSVAGGASADDDEGSSDKGTLH